MSKCYDAKMICVTLTVHQKTLNETHKTTFSIHSIRILSNTRIPSSAINYHFISSKFQPSERPAERVVGLNIRQRQERLLELQQLASLKLEFIQTKTPISTISDEPRQNTSRFNYPSSLQQRSLVFDTIGQLLATEKQSSQSWQFPTLTIATFEPKAPVGHFMPQRLSNSSALSRVPQGQSPTAAQDTRKNLLSTNDVFLECCKKKNVNTKCESRCNFDILDRRVLMTIFIGSGPCPRNNGRSLLSCAAQGSDHTDCCRAYNVQRTAAGDKCLLFCQTFLEFNFQADISMIPSWAVLKKIKQCFRLALIQKYNIKKIT